MPLELTATETTFELKEPDEWYTGQLVTIEETPDNGYGEGLKWVIEVDGDTFEDGTPRQTWAFCSQKLSPRSKLYGWLKGFDMAPEAGQTVDLAKLEGKAVDVMFEHGEKQDGTPTDKVVKIRASKTKTTSQAVPSAKTVAQPQQDELDAPF